jgi:hypothetical protein
MVGSDGTSGSDAWLSRDRNAEFGGSCDDYLPKVPIPTR